MIDFIITFAILLMFIGEPLYNSGYIMRFRIVEKHDGENYYYIIQQQWFVFWVTSSYKILKGDHKSSKSCEKAIDNYELMMNTNHVILEKTIEG